MDDLLAEHLTERLEGAVNRHLAVAQDWLPHEYVPWSEGRNFAGVLPDGEAWDVGQSTVSDTARTALVVNLLTEDNLPSYHREIYQSFGPDGAWGTWIGRWTAEMFLIFHLLRPNVLPLDDIGLIKGISVNYFSGEPVSRAEAREVGDAWAPYRSVATWYIWRSLDPIPVSY